MRDGSTRIARQLGDAAHRLRAIPIPGTRRAAAEPPEDPEPATSTAGTLAEIGETVHSAAGNHTTRVGGDAVSSPDDDPVPGEQAPVRA